VASNESPAALDDLAWLGVEPDGMTSAPRVDRYAATCDGLIASGHAYQCFCGATEFREMQPNSSGIPEAVQYDGRCRLLSEDDRKALRKGGRAPSIRLIVPPGTSVTITTVEGRSSTAAPDFDFALTRSEGGPMPAFAALVDDQVAKADIGMVEERFAAEIPYRAIIAKALGWELPRLAILPEWKGTAGALAIGELRAGGYHPRAVIQAIARAGWDPGDDIDVAAMAARFSLTDLASVVPDLDVASLRSANGAVLRALPEAERIQAVSEHLTRRGYPIAEREAGWQARFVATATAEMNTLADAELLASLLLIPTVDYDKDMARTIRLPTTQALVTEFERALEVVTTGSDAEWQEAVLRFRAKAEAPGRALGTLRMVLTGNREGPQLAPVLALLGIEKCRSRIDKARRYAGAT
jgi:glutamyl/glutaminyl-tRNA synthetase